MPNLQQTRSRAGFRLAWLLAGAILLGVAGAPAQAEDGEVRVDPYEKKPFTFKEPVPKKPARFCSWREGGAAGSCPVGPATPIGDPCECVRTIEHAVTRHRGRVVAQQ